ncbi:MAG: hypothetical protein ACFFCZ_05555 [Promethearchaeota archaeon]
MFLDLTLGDINKGKFVGEKGLELAQEELREFKEKYKRLPGSKDKGMRGITHAIARREWKPQGIITWNDLMEATFNDLNMGRYVGKRGLERAMKELLEFEKENKRLPNTRDEDLFGVRSAVYRGEWQIFRINSWSKLIQKTFGEEKIRAEKTKKNVYRGKYKGNEGLEKAIEKLRKFREENGRRPTIRDSGMNTIVGVIRKGVWEEFGISSWVDLLKKAFGEGIT